MRSVRRLATALLLLAAFGCSGTGDTPLTEAAANGDRPALIRLLAAGADPDELDGAGLTPLVHAVRGGHVKLIGILVSRGADPDLRDADDGWTPLMHAIHRKDMHAVRGLLNAGADPNAASSTGGTALAMAAGLGFPRITGLLLERGADPRVRDESGRVALSRAMIGVFTLDHITVGECQTETVRALVEAAPELRPEEGSWALRLARLKRCHEIVELVTGG